MSTGSRSHWDPPTEFADGSLLVSLASRSRPMRRSSLPRLEGRRIDGVPADEDGFLRVDEHCRVIGTERIFAAVT